MAALDAGWDSNAGDGIGLRIGLVAHGDVTFRYAQYALFQDATVREQLLHFAKSQQTNLVDDLVDKAWLQEPARGPSSDAMLDFPGEILNVRREQMRFDWKGAGRRLNPEAARHSPNFLRKRALLLPRANMLDDRIGKCNIKRTIAEWQFGCIAHYGCEATVLNRTVIQDIQ